MTQAHGRSVVDTESPIETSAKEKQYASACSYCKLRPGRETALSPGGSIRGHRSSLVGKFAGFHAVPERGRKTMYHCSKRLTRECKCEECCASML